MLMSHRQCFVLTLNDVGSFVSRHIALDSRNSVNPDFNSSKEKFRNNLQLASFRRWMDDGVHLWRWRWRKMGSIWDDAIRVTQNVNRRMMEQYNSRIQPYIFKKRDRVWKRSWIRQSKGKKLLHRWNGPGTITWIGEWGAAEVEDIYGGTKMHNLDDLKPYFHWSLRRSFIAIREGCCASNLRS